MKYAICFLFLSVSLGIAAQTVPGYYPAADIPVYSLSGDSLKHGFAGGLNAPQFSPIDLNGDGIRDLLVYDRVNRLAMTFLNMGTPGAVDYKYAPQYMGRFPQGTENFMLARDYNCDGIEDLFFYGRASGSNGGIYVWSGSRDAEQKIQFEPVVEELVFASMFPTQPIMILNPDLPNLSDMDGDGDLDIASFALDFSFLANVYYYENQSADLGYGCDSLIMVLRHQCWGLFAESGMNNTVILSPGIDSCAMNPYWNFRDERGLRHEGSTLTALDHNGDGVVDMVMGDVSANNLNLLTGALYGDTVLVVQQDAQYPVYDVPVGLFSMPAAYFLDADNDGTDDMLAAVNEVGYGQAVTDSVVWFYKGAFSGSNLQFEFQQKTDFLVGDMLDLGHYTAPAFFDYNADGLLDLVVGLRSRIYSDGNAEYGSLCLLENIGTPTEPAFRLTDRDYGGFSALGLFALRPTFGDLDGDGDQDLLLGNTNGDLYYAENTAGAGNTAAWAAPQGYYQGIDAWSWSSPQLFDLNQDGLLDIIVGTGNGNMNYHQNTGTAANPVFSDIPTSATLGWFDASLMGGSGKCAPHFVRTADGGTQLFVGHERGQVVQLGNIDGNVLGVYDTLNINFLYHGQFSVVAAADLDGDDTLEIVVGSAAGGLAWYRWGVMPQDTLVSVGIPTADPNLSIDFAVFPNPTSGLLTLSPSHSLPEQTRLTLYDVLGRTVQTRMLGGTNEAFNMDISHLQAGMYIVELRTPQGQSKSVKLHKY